MRAQGPSSNAVRAALIARCVSSRPARATRAHGSSVAGLIESTLLPDFAGRELAVDVELILLHGNPPGWIANVESGVAQPVDRGQCVPDGARVASAARVVLPIEAMDLTYSPEELAFQREVRTWLKTNVPKRDRRDDRVDGVARPDAHRTREGVAAQALRRRLRRHGLAARSTAARAPTSCSRPSSTRSWCARARRGIIGMMGIQMVGPDADRARHRGAAASATCRRSSPPTRSGVRATPSRAPAPIWPRSRRAPSSSATSSSSTARRSGPRTRSTPTGCSAWCAPIPRRRSTAASRTS